MVSCQSATPVIVEAPLLKNGAPPFSAAQLAAAVRNDVGSLYNVR